MWKIVPVLAGVTVATLAACSAAQASLVDFGADALGGTLSYSGGAMLNTSSTLDLDNAMLVVTTIGAGDDSGLSVFPSGTDNTVMLTHPINYGSGSGSMSTPIGGGDIFKTWTGSVNGQSDSFTETLTTVTNINRGTADAITVTLTGTLTDTLGLFVDAPTELILSANQVGGPNGAISVAMTNSSLVSGIPESSTWLMMALGFIGLGYAAVRRSSKDQALDMC